MIIAAALEKDSLKSRIDEHFGRCAWYGVYNTRTRSMAFIENKGRTLEQGAGQASVKLLIKQKVTLAVAGRFGTKAATLLNEHNIQMIIPETKQTFEQILKHIKN